MMSCFPYSIGGNKLTEKGERPEKKKSSWKDSRELTARRLGTTYCHPQVQSLMELRQYFGSCKNSLSSFTFLSLIFWFPQTLFGGGRTEGKVRKESKYAAVGEKENSEEF